MRLMWTLNAIVEHILQCIYRTPDLHQTNNNNNNNKLNQNKKKTKKIYEHETNYKNLKKMFVFGSAKYIY